MFYRRQTGKGPGDGTTPPSRPDPVPEPEAEPMYRPSGGPHADVSRNLVKVLVATIFVAGVAALVFGERGLMDVRRSRHELQEVREKVYDRMIAERKRIADKYRSEGQGEASKILGLKERELKSITSEAFKTSEEIRGRADAEVTRIYASAYNRNDDSREFYKFLKTMETYESTFNKDDWLILSSDSDFYKYLKRQSGR